MHSLKGGCFDEPDLRFHVLYNVFLEEYKAGNPKAQAAVLSSLEDIAGRGDMSASYMKTSILTQAYGTNILTDIEHMSVKRIKSGKIEL
jgi:hypothetical protein